METRSYVIEFSKTAADDLTPRWRDNGNTKTYYGRGYFTTDTTYNDSTHYKWHVC
jgi:hypothetical protein